jgi:hypothetical protein
MKALIWIFLTLGGLLGGWLGSLLDHGNVFGAGSIILGTLGSLSGIWVAYKINQNY